jgi:dTMP kinase
VKGSTSSPSADIAGSLSRAPVTPGCFIVLDGPDGCGKSTQIALLAERLRAEGRDVLCTVDPGGTAVGQRIRQILLSKDSGDLDPRTEACLYMASRAQLMAEVILPALCAGRVVLCDRFVSSTIAYQGIGGGLDPAAIVDMAEQAIGGRWPHLTVVLMVPPERGLSRITREKDRMESKDLAYHRRVHAGFRSLAGLYPGPLAFVDAEGTVEAVAERVWKAVADALR